MNCCVLGAGAWGTAMALHLHRCGHAVTLVPRRMDHALALASSRENTDYLPGFPLPHALQVGCELVPALMEAEVVFLACPSKALRPLCARIERLRDAAWRLRALVVLSKGMELETFKTPTEILSEECPGLAAAVVTGPTYALEVARGQPTAVVFAADASDRDAERDQRAFSNENFRAYLSRDPRGAELGGALKNVYAIASGMCEGLGLGDNARAALLTRSLGEMVRLGERLGGRRETFYGLSGFGDLVATCTGAWSRNRTFGERIGRGEDAATILAAQNSVVEGYRATAGLFGACGGDADAAPILCQMRAILYEGRQPGEALRALMQRELKCE